MTAHPEILQSLIIWLGTHRGATPRKLRAAGFKVDAPLKGGKFRQTFPVPDAGAVLKIPRPYHAMLGDPPWMNPVRHSLVEIDTVERIRTQVGLRHLRKYTAEIYYADRRSGLILMKAYHPRPRGLHLNREESLLVDIFRESLGKWTADYGLNNLLRDDDLTPIVVDLGY